MAQPAVQQQQSWAAWLLDAYASSVAPSPTEEVEYDSSEESGYDSASPTISHASMASSNSSSLPHGPYFRTGRGGAGNFQWEAPQSAADVEAQNGKTLRERRKTALTIEHLDTSAAVQSSRAQKRSSQYIKTGRGGAGNIPYVQSNSPQQSPRSASFILRSPVSSASPLTHVGRGGAGNFAAAVTANEQILSAKAKEERLKAQKTREAAEHQVENLLQPPTQAWLGGRRKSAIPDEFELPNWH